MITHNNSVTTYFQFQNSSHPAFRISSLCFRPQQHVVHFGQFTYFHDERTLGFKVRVWVGPETKTLESSLSEWVPIVHGRRGRSSVCYVGCLGANSRVCLWASAFCHLHEQRPIRTAMKFWRTRKKWCCLSDNLRCDHVLVQAVVVLGFRNSAVDCSGLFSNTLVFITNSNVSRLVDAAMAAIVGGLLVPIRIYNASESAYLRGQSSVCSPSHCSTSKLPQAVCVKAQGSGVFEGEELKQLCNDVRARSVISRRDALAGISVSAATLAALFVRPENSSAVQQSLLAGRIPGLSEPDSNGSFSLTFFLWYIFRIL